MKMADDTIAPEPMRNDPDFKMGIGQRILGIANNFLQGMAHHPAVTNTGRGAINEGKYGVAHSKWLDQAKRATAAGSGGQQTGKEDGGGGGLEARKARPGGGQPPPGATGG